MKRKAAFTLIELLVVIAIIAILAAILFPVFAQAKAAAKLTQSLSNTKQIALGLLMYSNDYDDHTVSGIDSNGTPGPYTTWFDWIQPYIKSVPLGYSPGYSGPKPMTNMWLDTANGTYGTYLMNYAINAMITGGWTDRGEMSANMGSVPSPANTIFIAETSANLPFMTSSWAGCSDFLGLRGQSFNVITYPDRQVDVPDWMLSDAGGKVMAISASVPAGAADGHARTMSQFHNFKGTRGVIDIGGGALRTVEDPVGGWNGLWCQPKDWPVSWKQ